MARLLDLLAFFAVSSLVDRESHNAVGILENWYKLSEEIASVATSRLPLVSRRILPEVFPQALGCPEDIPGRSLDESDNVGISR